MSDRNYALDALLTTAVGLGADELLVLGYLAKRLAKGAEEYGPLALLMDDRDFIRELWEEHADAANYAAMAAVRDDMRRSATLAPSTPLRVGAVCDKALAAVAVESLPAVLRGAAGTDPAAQ